MRLNGQLMLSRGDLYFFKTTIPDFAEQLEDSLYEFTKSRGRGPGEMVESLFLDSPKRAGMGLPEGEATWWSGWKIASELPDNTTLQTHLDESDRVIDVRVATQDPSIYDNRPRYGGTPMYNERQVAADAMNKMATIKKNHPAKVVTERDFAKAQSDALVEQLSDDDAYWQYRREHDAKIAKASSSTPEITYYADETMESKIEKLRRQTLGPETVYETFSWALDLAADELMDEFPGESHAQLVGRLLDEEPIAKAWDYATTAGRAQSYDSLVHQVRKSSYQTQGGLALDVINDLVGD